MIPAKVHSKNLVVIPKEIREKYGIKEGSRIVFIEEKDGIKIVKESTFKNWLHKLGEKEFSADWESKEDEIWDKY